MTNNADFQAGYEIGMRNWFRFPTGIPPNSNPNFEPRFQALNATLQHYLQYNQQRHQLAHNGWLWPGHARPPGHPRATGLPLGYPRPTGYPRVPFAPSIPLAPRFSHPNIPNPAFPSSNFPQVKKQTNKQRLLAAKWQASLNSVPPEIEPKTRRIEPTIPANAITIKQEPLELAEIENIPLEETYFTAVNDLAEVEDDLLLSYRTKRNGSKNFEIS